MKLYIGISVSLFCLFSEIRADNSLDLEKCERDLKNCENFSFRRNHQNVSDAVNNNSSDQKSLKSVVLNDLGLVEKQIMLEQTNIQENGNFNHK